MDSLIKWYLFGWPGWRMMIRQGLAWLQLFIRHKSINISGMEMTEQVRLRSKSKFFHTEDYVHNHPYH